MPFRARPILLATMLAATLGCAAPNGPVVFGAAGKWSTPYGTMSKRGIELAVTEVNAAGGLGGHPLEIRFADDDASGTKAALVADSLANDPRVVAVVGHLTSGAMTAAASVYDAARLPAVATTATAPDLTGISPWVFRVVGSDSASGLALAHFADSLGKARTAILYENDAYGRGLADAFRRAYRGAVVSVDPIAPGETDFAMWIDWLRAQRADLVFMAGAEVSGAAFIEQARRAGLTATLLGSDGWAPVADEAVAESVYVGVPFAPSDPRPTAAAFVRAFTNRYGVIPDNNAALAYDAVRLLADAVRRVGADRKAIRAWLADGGSLDGATGQLTLGPNGDPRTATLRMTRLRNRTLTLVGAP